jgi:SAM-dependent methyltransferase
VTAQAQTEIMRCPACGCTRLQARVKDGPPAGEPVESVECTACGLLMSLAGGVLETTPSGDEQLPYWDKHYAAEDQGPLVEALKTGFARPRLLRAHYPLVRLAGGLPLPLDSSIELGCGSGAFSLVLKKLGMVEKVTLLDYSMASLESARRLFELFEVPCELVHSKIESAPFKPGSFDLALSAGVIEHYRLAAERQGCLDKHLELGRFAFVQAPVSAPFYWLPRAAYTLARRGWPFGYERPVRFAELRSMTGLACAELLAWDHQYFLSFPLFTRLHRLFTPGWYTLPFMNEMAILATRYATVRSGARAALAAGGTV